MADTKKSVIKRLLGGYFAGLVARDSEAGVLKVTVPDFTGVNAIIITNENNGTVWRIPVEEQGDELDIFNASVNGHAYNIGAVLPDGWVVGPVSPTTGKLISIEPVSGALKGYQTWYAGEEHAKKLCDKGHRNARQPRTAELNVLCEEFKRADCNKNAQFDFSSDARRYWSSELCWLPGEERVVTAHTLYFGHDSVVPFHAAVDKACGRSRCIRDEPGLSLA